MATLQHNTYSSNIYSTHTSTFQHPVHRFGESFCHRYDQLHHHVHKMPMELKRKITQFNHVSDCSEHLFLPLHGITLGEYNVLYFLIYSHKRKDYQSKSQERASTDRDLSSPTPCLLVPQSSPAQPTTTQNVLS